MIGFDGIALLLEPGDLCIDFLDGGVFFLEVGAEFLLLGFTAFVSRIFENSNQVGRKFGASADLAAGGEAEVSNNAPLTPVLWQRKDEGGPTCLFDWVDQFEGSPMGFSELWIDGPTRGWSAVDQACDVPVLLGKVCLWAVQFDWYLALVVTEGGGEFLEDEVGLLGVSAAGAIAGKHGI